MAGIEVKEVIILSSHEHILINDTIRLLCSVLEFCDCNNADRAYDIVNSAVTSLNEVMNNSITEL